MPPEKRERFIQIVLQKRAGIPIVTEDAAFYYSIMIAYPVSGPQIEADVVHEANMVQQGK